MTWQNATLTVGSEPQQRFEGFGFSFEHDNPYGLLSEERRAEVDRLLYDELDTRIIRLWYAAGPARGAARRLQASGIIPRALAAAASPSCCSRPRRLSSATPTSTPARIAEDIRVMRDDYGIRITTTGVINEPDAEDWKLLPASDYVPLTIALRRELDARGLGDVKVDRSGVRQRRRQGAALARRGRGRPRGARLVRRARHPLLQHGGDAGVRRAGAGPTASSTG